MSKSISKKLHHMYSLVWVTDGKTMKKEGYDGGIITD